MKLLGREPAQWLQLFSALLILASSLGLNLTEGQQGALNAALAAIFGVATALAVSAEKAAPLVAGLVQALIAVALAFNLDLSPDVQAGIMVAVNAGVAWYLRTQVSAPVPPGDEALRARS